MATPSSRTDITVLIEQKDFTPFASLRRASLTPSLAHSSGASSSGTVTGGGNNPGSGGEWKRGQRSSTTLHASIDCPDSLLASLSSIAIVCIQPNLVPLPPSRPLLLLVQLSDYIPQELSTTPSSICFPPMATPTPKSIQRALVPLKLAVSTLDSVNQRNDVAILAYSDNVHLPVEITNAAYNEGAHGLITPPFTPASVQSAIYSALDTHARQPPIPPTSPHTHAPVYPPTPESTDTPLPPSSRLYEPIDPLDTSRNDLHDYHDSNDHDEFNENLINIDTESTLEKGVHFPIADVPKTRRASVDTGGLHMSAGNEAGNNGCGWAGWDSSVPRESEFEDEGNELDVAQLILSMHLQATAALSNASSSSTSAIPNGGAYHTHQHSHPLQPSSYQQPQLHRSPSANALNSMGTTNVNIAVHTTNPRTISRLTSLLSSWHFEPYLLSPPETLLCVQLLFTSLLTSLATPPDILPPSIARSNDGLQAFIQTNLVPFISDLARLYRRENRYHSFIHALDVLQAVYTFLESEGRVGAMKDMAYIGDPNATSGQWSNSRVKKVDNKGEWSGMDLLSDKDLFLLCLAAIGHDVGHPGNSNAFLKNAQAPLSKIYDDRSALERMHCTLLLRLLRQHGMGHLICHETKEGRQGRWLIAGTVLATDMSWHFEWVENFGRAMKERRIVHQLQQQPQRVRQTASGSGRRLPQIEERRGSAIRIGSSSLVEERRGSGPELVVNASSEGTWVVEQTDLEAALAEGRLDMDPASREEAEKQDRLFVCQALMKCADISNPARPHSISRHWSTVLLEEWAAQALLERHLGLPVSVVADANEKVQCVGQVSFIKLFTQPLFDLVAEAVPGVSTTAKQCTENRILWEQRLATFDPPSSSVHAPQMIRPIPLALPILSPMARYAKTVIPLSLPNLSDRKKQPRAARELASMSPWHAMKSTNTGTSGTSAGASSAGTGSRPWSRSRPESVSSNSTLSSLPGSTGAAAVLSPSTPTSTGFASSGYGRSPASPTMSMSPFGLPLTSATTSSSAASGYPYGGVPLASVWDVDSEVAEKAVRELRHGWGVRDGRRERRRVDDERDWEGRRGSASVGNVY